MKIYLYLGSKDYEPSAMTYDRICDSAESACGNRTAESKQNKIHFYFRGMADFAAQELKKKRLENFGRKRQEEIKITVPWKENYKDGVF